MSIITLPLLISISASRLSAELEEVIRVFDDPSSSDILRAVAVKKGWEVLARLEELEAPAEDFEQLGVEPTRDEPAKELRGQDSQGGGGDCPETEVQDPSFALAVYVLLGFQTILQLWITSMVTRCVPWRTIAGWIRAHCRVPAPAPTPTPTRWSGRGRSPDVPAVVVHPVSGLRPLHLSPIRVRSPARSCPLPL